VGSQTPSSDRAIGLVTLLCGILALLAVIGSLIGLLVMGGPGPHIVITARGASVSIYGKGIYAADSWLLGTGNRGQDVAILLVEVPFLLLTLWWYRRGGTVAPLP
jgi:predicted membrane protein